jgi:predicted transcriptional regulator of viral defense system
VTLTVEQLRGWLDRVEPGTFVVIQAPGGADLDDVARVAVADDHGQTGERVLVLVPDR